MQNTPRLIVACDGMVWFCFKRKHKNNNRIIKCHLITMEYETTFVELLIVNSRLAQL